MTLALDLSDKVAVVTGGTSGIGLATADLLLRAGANVVICGRDPDRLESAIDSLASTHQEARLLGAQCDVLDAGGVARLRDAAVARFAGVDMLICNAGQGRQSTFADTTDAAWREETDLKLFSVIHPIRAFHQALCASQSASIVCVNSLLARQPEPHMVATSAARAAVSNLVRSMAVEFAADTIRVNAILLGLIDSGQWRRRYEAANTQTSYEQWCADLAAGKQIPMGRLGRSEEAAHAVVYLASPWSSYVTGTFLDVSGGVARNV